MEHVTSPEALLGLDAKVRQLSSDADDQILLTISFKNPVCVRELFIFSLQEHEESKQDSTAHPSSATVFYDPGSAFDFSDAESALPALSVESIDFACEGPSSESRFLVAQVDLPNKNSRVTSVAILLGSKQETTTVAGLAIMGLKPTA